MSRKQTNKDLAKRFYKTVSVGSISGPSSEPAPEPSPKGFHILLDGRVLKTPGKLQLILRDGKMAALIAKEWDAQTEQINPVDMPLTRLANVAVEQTSKRRDDLVAEARKYAGTDLLCYRATLPVDLAQRQAELWDPVLHWAAEQGVNLKTTQSVKAIPQADTALDAIADFARTLDNFDLTLLVHLIAVYGSAVLGFAVMKARLTGEAAFALSRLDEIWQNEQWGEDEDAKIRADPLRAEIISLCQLLED